MQEFIGSKNLGCHRSWRMQWQLIDCRPIYTCQVSRKRYPWIPFPWNTTENSVVTSEFITIAVLVQLPLQWWIPINCFFKLVIVEHSSLTYLIVNCLTWKQTPRRLGIAIDRPNLRQNPKILLLFIDPIHQRPFLKFGRLRPTFSCNFLLLLIERIFGRLSSILLTESEEFALIFGISCNRRDLASMNVSSCGLKRCNSIGEFRFLNV